MEQNLYEETYSVHSEVQGLVITDGGGISAAADRSETRTNRIDRLIRASAEAHQTYQRG